MCGIVGIAGLPAEKAGPLIERMSACVAHRGPDAEGRFIDDGIAFGHRRLAIVDLSRDADHPFFDPSGRYAVMVNGEIYNYREIRSELKNDFDFRTASDTEVVLAAFMKHGPTCLEKLFGMFAIAIWDNADKSLFLARDRLGVKPLYYSLTDDGALVFGSEIRSILSSGLVARKIDDHSLFEYLMYQSTYSPGTIVENVRQLGAGECATFTSGKLTTKKWWRIEAPRAPHGDDRATTLRKVRDLLRRSVESRMISDVPLGAFLSGGIDSSAVVGLMSEVATSRVRTFSVTFAEKEYDESQYSRLVAERFGTEHTEVRLQGTDLLDELPTALAAMDSPSGDGLNTYVVSKAARASGLSVALSGIGGDELFAGYHYFRSWERTRKGVLGRSPSLLRRAVAGAYARSRDSRRQRIAGVLAGPLDIASVYPRIRQAISYEVASELRSNGDHRIVIEQILRERLPEIENFPLLSQLTIAELLGYTQNVLLKDIDQFSMAWALEVREPLLDHRLLEYVLGVPDSYKLSPTTPKTLLVDALDDLVPPEVVNRPKMGFVIPFDKWMRRDLRELCESSIGDIADRDLLDADVLRAKWQKFLDHGAAWSELWHIVVLSQWLRRNDL